ncbi:uncharacterized protein G2W53_034974 [Senna tora]|uniref:Uncharacterized protein n=1 Tax=Senna tora TaxID=362788 RepID=A0A834SRJ8_9FABA|nr:uncharacterized protein G2W53_034974 [Senna tora]
MNLGNWRKNEGNRAKPERGSFSAVLGAIAPQDGAIAPSHCPQWRYSAVLLPPADQRDTETSPFPMVISANVHGDLVKRILVDQGSSVDVLYYHSSSKMGGSYEDLQQSSTKTTNAKRISIKDKREKHRKNKKPNTSSESANTPAPRRPDRASYKRDTHNLIVRARPSCSESLRDPSHSLIGKTFCTKYGKGRSLRHADEED